MRHVLAVYFATRFGVRSATVRKLWNRRTTAGSLVEIYGTTQPDTTVQVIIALAARDWVHVDILKWGIVSVFVGGFIVGACALFVLAVESVWAVFYLKPEAYQHRYVRWNWFNALPRREMFTETGMVHRRRALLAALWFLGALVGCGMLLAITSVARRYGS